MAQQLLEGQALFIIKDLRSHCHLYTAHNILTQGYIIRWHRKKIEKHSILWVDIKVR